MIQSVDAPHKRQAVLDSSFWTLTCTHGIEIFLRDFFLPPILVPRPVWLEMTSPLTRGMYVYTEARRMERALEDGWLAIPSENQYEPYHEFGEGERHAMGIARSFDTELLINDYRPFSRAQELGISAISVPHLVILLVKRGIMHPNRGLHIINDIRWVTSAALIDLAGKEIKRIHRELGNHG